MKNRIALFTMALVLAVQGSAFAEAPLKVTATQRGKDLSVRFSTVKINPAMCRLHVTKMNLESVLPVPHFGHVEPAPGRIAVQARLLPSTPCLTAFGPHSGGFLLKVGRTLPAVSPGEYELFINGHQYDNIIVE